MDYSTLIKDVDTRRIKWDVDVREFVKAVFRLDWTDILPESHKLSASRYPRRPRGRRCGVTNVLLMQLYGVSGPVPKDTSLAKAQRQASEHRAHDLLVGAVRTYAGKVGTRTCEAFGEHHLKEARHWPYWKQELPLKLKWEWAMVLIDVERTDLMGVNDPFDMSLMKEADDMLVALVCLGFLRLSTHLASGYSRNG